MKDELVIRVDRRTLYWIGAAAEHLVATPSSIIGSIGTYMSLIKEKLRINYLAPQPVVLCL